MGSHFFIETQNFIETGTNGGWDPIMGKWGYGAPSMVNGEWDPIMGKWHFLKQKNGEMGKWGDGMGKWVLLKYPPGVTEAIEQFVYFHFSLLG